MRPAAKTARLTSGASIVSVVGLLRAASNDQSPAPRGNSDRDLGTRIGIEAVGFDAAAEDDAVFRHQRADAQLFSGGRVGGEG